MYTSFKNNKKTPEKPAKECLNFYQEHTPNKSEN